MGSVSQQGRGSPLYALGSVISYAFFFLVEFSFYKGHENLFKRLLLLWKNKSRNVSRTLSPHSKFLPSFLPSLSLWSFLSPRLLICRAIPDFFFSVLYCQHPSVFPRHHLFSSYCLWNNLYTLIRIFPLSLCPTIPSSHSDFPGSSFWAGTVCSLRYLTPLAVVPCTWEEFTLREPSLSLLSSLCHPNPIALLPPVLYHLTWSCGISHSGHFLPHVVLPCVPRHYSLMCPLVIL